MYLFSVVSHVFRLDVCMYVECTVCNLLLWRYSHVTIQQLHAHYAEVQVDPVVRACPDRILESPTFKPCPLRMSESLFDYLIIGLQIMKIRLLIHQESVIYFLLCESFQAYVLCFLGGMGS